MGAPTGKWQLIVIYRGKHCPVSRSAPHMRCAHLDMPGSQACSIWPICTQDPSLQSSTHMHHEMCNYQLPWIWQSCGQTASHSCTHACRNYLASIQQLHYELDEMGCEVLAVSADGREKAEGFVSAAPLAFYHTPRQHDAVSCMPPA